MTSLIIEDSQLESIKDKVVLITGASSGIGLATLRRVIQHGGKPFASDLNPLPEPEASNSVPFHRTDVTSWAEQSALFQAAYEHYGRIDHVFANAGILPTASLLEEDVDENGALLPPKLNTVNVNYIGVMYTCKLAIWYLKKNKEQGGSIVLTSSASAFQRFPATDYTSTKHAVLGLMRALLPSLSKLPMPIRINAICPSWTLTGIIVNALLAAIGESNTQPADVPARSTLLLMCDETRNGHFMYSDKGEFLEIENGENGMDAHVKRMLKVGGEEETNEIAAMKRLSEATAKAKEAKGEADAEVKG